MRTEQRPDLDGATMNAGSPGTTSPHREAGSTARRRPRTPLRRGRRVNGPKTWSLRRRAPTLTRRRLRGRTESRAGEVIDCQSRSTRPRASARGQQVQVPVEKIEAAVVRHYTSCAGDPHRHLHLQINARASSCGTWRGLHSVGVVDPSKAPTVSATLPLCATCSSARHFRCPRLSSTTSARQRVTPYADGSANALHRSVATSTATLRPSGARQPQRRPGTCCVARDRRARADARPDKIAPKDGRELRPARWNES